MADNTILNVGSGGDVIATDDINGVKHQLVKVQYGGENEAVQVSDANPLPTTDAALAASLASLDTKLTNPLPTTDASASASLASIDGKLTNPLPVLSILNPTSFSLDAGARLRTSSLTTLGDYKTLGADEALLLENIGTGTGLWANNVYNMSVASGEYLIRQSRRHHPYLSGKSQQVELTLIGFSGTVSLVVQNSGTDVFRIAQTDWNVNPLPGHDWSTFNVIIFDFLWLGGAMLRTFVVTDEGIILVDMRNVASTVAGLIFKSPNQPVRYEIRSDGAITTKRVGYFSSNIVAPYDSNKDGFWLESVTDAATGSMVCVCSQVSTEGSINESGKIRSVNTGSTAISLGVVGTTYPVKAIRLGAAFQDRYVKVSGISGFVSSVNDTLLMTLQLNPTLSAPLSYTSVANSSAEQADGNGTITVTSPGTILFSQIITQNSVFSPESFIQDFLTVIGTTIEDVSDQLVLCGTPITTTIATFGTINYKEY
jgi:hypothetical protein